MRLSNFISLHLEPILQQWEDFARTIQPAHRTLDVVDLRDHAEEMLREIAAVLEAGPADDARNGTPQLRASRSSTGPRTDTAAETHATHRLLCGFTIDQLVAEYRALRASVLSLWANRNKTATWFEIEDMTRFNEAIDQALAQSVARYSAMARQAQDIFIGILGHDIRTPLSAISVGAATLMRAESLESKYIQLASRMFNSSARISGLVNDLLDFTHARFGMQLSPTPENLGALAQHVIEEIRSACPDRTIVIGAAGDLDGTWDSGRICQVLSNLVGNALQHGSIAEPVSVSLQGEPEHVVLAVHNVGEPIPEADIGQIFEPLHRAARASRREPNMHANLGLGLYIAREAVLAHGGAISVQSNRADGTTFTVRLPRRRPAALH